MVTEVIMKRELFGCVISQKSKNEFFSATDLLVAGNKWRLNKGLPIFNLARWFALSNTKEFVKRLEDKFGEIRIISKGKNSHTWVHPFLFIDIALAISPDLKLEVYGWLFDYLIKYRNESGDSYRKMCGALYVNQGNKQEFDNYIIDVANKIREACGVSDWNTATENQLKIRNKIHESIFTLADILKNNDNIVDTAIKSVISYEKNQALKGKGLLLEKST